MKRTLWRRVGEVRVQDKAAAEHAALEWGVLGALDVSMQGREVVRVEMDLDALGGLLHEGPHLLHDPLDNGRRQVLVVHGWMCVAVCGGGCGGGRRVVGAQML